MKIAKGINIEAVDYASQGNAILGIRDSGKTYTATYLAEQLLDEGIPIVAFDPISVFRYLKSGKKGKGFPVVVAGGDHGDLPLTPENAVNILRAAMQENVSIIFDLYSMNLSKSDWKKIVGSCIRCLLYENKSYGLRHIFLEEASEFVPQIVRPEDGVVYAEIEKLARMGGNASLGYTLINQRAEQVNKAVLELCDCLFLHRQKGRHSLTALGKWLDVADTSNSKEIINSLPSLEQGECWVWMQGSHDPKRVNIPEKKTIHPDRKNPLVKVSSGVTADVSTFVSRMKITLEELPQPSAKDKPVKKMENNNNGTIVAELEAKVSNLQHSLLNEKTLRQQAERKVAVIKDLLWPQYEGLRKLFDEIKPEENGFVDNGTYKIWLDKFDGKHKTMLELIIEHKRLDRRKWCVLAGISYNSTWFDKGATKMKQLKLISKEGTDFVLQPM